LGLIVLVIVIANLPNTPPTPEEQERQQKQDAAEQRKKQKDDEAFKVDYQELTAAGKLAVIGGDANDFEISGWHTSLDLHLGTLSETKASALANFLCYQTFKTWNSQTPWNVRVFLVDGRLAAQCPIRRASR
jgi:hypothetical protein